MAGISAALRGEPVPAEVRARALRRRRYLWTFEAGNAVLLPAIAAYLVRSSGARVGLATVSGAVLCGVLLLEGAAYWFLKRRQLRDGRAREPLPHRRVFAAVRAVGPTVLAVGALAWVSSLLSGAAGVDLVVGALLWLLAVAEHVNYHHVQLMHDTRADWRRLRRTRHLRRSFLAADLDRVDRSG